MGLDGVGRGSERMGIALFGLCMDGNGIAVALFLFAYLFVGMIYSGSCVSFVFFIFHFFSLNHLVWYSSQRK